MSDFLHGAYGNVSAVANRITERGAAFVYIGTAPVHTLENGANNKNVPVVVSDMDEARSLFGYSDDWAKYTLCEAMYYHLTYKGVGPLVLINVLDPATNIASSGGTATKTPANGRVTLTDAENIILDTIVVKTGAGQDAETKTKGTDYRLSYDADAKIITIQEVTAGSLGTSALTITYSLIDASSVTNAQVIGTSNGMGQNTGIQAVANVYAKTGLVPSFLAAPGFSSVKAIHDALAEISQKINGHWDAYIYADLPLMDGATPLTLETVSTYKEANGYNRKNETVFFPMMSGKDGKKYHTSVLAAGNLQELIINNDGIPYNTCSNTPCDLIENLYMGESNVDNVYDDRIINNYLNRYGITSAAYMGGQWVIWGGYSAEFNENNKTSVNVSETNMMMLYYVSNDFQMRRSADVDKPLTPNDVLSIAAQEQTRLDALLSIGALIYGTVERSMSRQAMSDILEGGHRFSFKIQATPLARKLIADVAWTEEGFTTYFSEEAA